MPVITVEGPEMQDMDKRRAFARALTDAAVEAYGLPESAMVVIMHENPLECVASGGELICDRGPRE
ncbi:MAG: tautomerase family protein [Thermoleophilia bacterium]|nr:tautomerase family protein [Thermoleophilia bacterium]